MKQKIIFLIFIGTIGVVSTAIAQLPYYLPTNGLVGWWPFNGNANDESNHGFDFIVHGASLTTDRFGINNSAYEFNGSNWPYEYPYPQIQFDLRNLFLLLSCC